MRIISFHENEAVENFLSFYQQTKKDHHLFGNQEYILGPRALSRVSSLSWEETKKWAKELKESTGNKVFLQWDILMTQSNFKAVCAQISQYASDINEYFDGIRVQDTGALFWLKEHKDIFREELIQEIHLICENGNHNLEGLKSWYNFWPENISRLVLSAEFPAQKLNELQGQLSCQLEVLGAGNILLFYTPRHLISPLYENENEEENNKLGEYKVFGTSEESPHKGFPIIENGHGTFMFNTKELYIFSEKEKLDELPHFIFRIDFPIESLTCEQWNLLFRKEHESFQNSRSMGHTKGFFRTNKTDVLFKKLKNHRLQDRDHHYVGDVVDVKKKEHVGILIKGKNLALKKGDEIRLLSPEGREKFVTLKTIWSADKENRESAKTGQIFFIPHVGGISVRTMVFKTEVSSH